jgi:hypothetical protein
MSFLWLNRKNRLVESTSCFFYEKFIHSKRSCHYGLGGLVAFSAVFALMVLGAIGFWLNVVSVIIMLGN